MHEPFGATWFAVLLAAHATPTPGPARDALRAVAAAELRIVAILGMAGIAKSSLAARVAQEAALSFERVYSRNLRDALPPASGWPAPSASSARGTPVLGHDHGTVCLLEAASGGALAWQLLASGGADGTLRTCEAAREGSPWARYRPIAPMSASISRD
jgi:hypothetical protein